ncbi:hypothetical protein R3P38DRAFT_3318881 [Favolaschia claudopus]|uniref:DUF6534 domain-containing protein n=1 Tax=Favolaschia claudopus TaxID=2862362 RepID=A0AAW0B1T2_9AGAR
MPQIITFLLESALFGVLTVQVWLYYQAFPNDRRFVKALVYFTYLLLLVDMLLSAIDAFRIYGSGFGDFSTLVSINFAWFTSPIMAAIASLIVQCFYAFRLHMFSKFRLIPVLIVICSFGVSISGFITGAFSLQAGDLTKVNTREIKIAVAVYLVGSAVLDIIIATCTTYAFMVKDTGFRRTHALITKLIRLSIETGSLTALVALITVVLNLALPNEGYYIVPLHIMPMVYSNTMFAVLNARFNIVHGRQTYISSTDLISLPTNLHNTTGGTHSGAVVSIDREMFSSAETAHPVEMVPINKVCGDDPK